jgi:mannitol/fructose-specific phosphotransferase system IIA component
LQSNIQYRHAVDFGATQIVKHVKGLATNNNETQHELALLVRHRFFRDFATCRHDAAQSYHCGILPIKGRLRLIVDA